ncbi:hypothetical protein BH23BAC2_BH23BAC2_18130 [soil metagenome]
MEYIILATIPILIIYYFINSLYKKIVKARELKLKIVNEINTGISLKNRTKQLEIENLEALAKYKGVVALSIDKLLEEKTSGFPWLATAISDYIENYDLIFANYLQNKKWPSFKKAEEIKRIASEKKEFKKQFLISKYIIEYYESLFPWSIP